MASLRRLAWMCRKRAKQYVDKPDVPAAPDGAAHFHYQTASMEGPEYEEVVFEAESPPKLLWECCEARFDDVIPEYPTE